MKYLAVVLFCISSMAFANSSSKAIAIEQFWKHLEASQNFSFTMVDNYRKSLPDEDPIRKLLNNETHFKASQSFVKSEFVTFIDTNFQTKEIKYLASVYRNSIFRKFGDQLLVFSDGKKLNPKIKIHIEEHLLTKNE